MDLDKQLLRSHETMAMNRMLAHLVEMMNRMLAHLVGVMSRMLARLVEMMNRNRLKVDVSHHNLELRSVMDQIQLNLVELHRNLVIRLVHRRILILVIHQNLVRHQVHFQSFLLGLDLLAIGQSLNSHKCKHCYRTNLELNYSQIDSTTRKQDALD